MTSTPGSIPKFATDGHFYSPIVDPKDLESRKAQLWPKTPPLRGIDYREAAQHELWEELLPLMADYPFPSEQPDPPGFFYGNGQFGGLDSLIYFGLLRKLRPQRLLEVGAGYSTMLAVETRERFLGDRPLIACIEPYPDPEIVRPFMNKVGFVKEPVWNVPLTIVDELEAGDIFFVDCSHVSKTGSDTHTVYFDLFPRLARGVYIQIHDIFLPFEYPYQWVVEDGRHWNEQYLVLALLSDSTRYEIVFGSAFFAEWHQDAVTAAFGNPQAGGSLWLRVR